MAEALRYSEDATILYVEAEGHITAALCADLRHLVFQRFDSDPEPHAMYVDLSLCEYMDSTFLGLLVGFNKRLLRSGAGKLNIVRPSAAARELLDSLGLLSLVEVVEGPVAFPSDMRDVVKTKTTGPDLLLRAHENLMELSEENKKRFAAVHSVLKNVAESNKTDQH